ncbi:MAG: sensor histidine kinase [Actinomycetota bacterium]
MRLRNSRPAQIDRARWHLWMATFAIMVALVAAVVFLAGSDNADLRLPLPSGRLRLGLGLLVLGFATYVVDRERNLRRLHDRLTEKRVESERLTARLEHLTEMEAMQRDFVSIVSHEIRAPLTAIKGFAKTLLQRGDSLSSDERRTFLSTVNAQSDRLARLVDDLLQVSRIDAHRLRLDVQPVSVGHAVAGLLPQFHAKWNRAIDLDLPASLPSVAADPGKLEDVLINLIDNAVKYSPSGAPVRVSGRADAGSVEIAIHDCGIGIAAEDMPKLFQKFQRLHSPAAREVGGTGLGLYIVKGLLEAMSGRVWVVSTPDQGSTFSFSLPLAEPGLLGHEGSDASVVPRDQPGVRGTQEASDASVVPRYEKESA